MRWFFFCLGFYTKVLRKPVSVGTILSFCQSIKACKLNKIQICNLRRYLFLLKSKIVFKFAKIYNKAFGKNKYNQLVWTLHEFHISFSFKLLQFVFPPSVFWEKWKKDEIAKYQKSLIKHVLPVLRFYPKPWDSPSFKF